MNNRIIALTGIHNFRDYGGYQGQDGARLRTGLLFRSGQHCDATDDDLVGVDALAIANVIDLRGDSERASYPCLRSPAFAGRVHFAEGETAGHAPHVEASKDVKTAADAKAAMTALYCDMPFRPRLIEIYTQYFAVLADHDGPSLIHCLAGKDRTGIAVALLHTLLGVHTDDIFADYLLTNTAGNIERRIAAGATAVRSGFGRGMNDDAVRALMSVDADYLNAAFAVIAAQHNSVENYCADVLGVTKDMRQRLKSSILA
jgi:protein-tyrosine phosphatase